MMSIYKTFAIALGIKFIQDIIIYVFKLEMESPDLFIILTTVMVMIIYNKIKDKK